MESILLTIKFFSILSIIVDYLILGSSSSIMANNTTQGSSSFDLSKSIQNGSSDSNSCNICHKAFSNHEVLKKHIKSHILNTSSHCAACGQDFPDRLALAKHQTEVRHSFNLENIKFTSHYVLICFVA